MTRFMSQAVAAGVIAVCSAGVGFADNLVPDPAGAYSDASGKVTTQYSKYTFVVWPSTPEAVWRKGETSLTVQGLNPQEYYVLLSTRSTGPTDDLGPFQPDGRGRFAFKNLLNGLDPDPRWRYVHYEVWRVDVDPITGDWALDGLVLTSNPH